MTIVNLKNAQSGSTARVAVDRGFNCFQFMAHLSDGRIVDVLEAPEDFADGGARQTHHGNPLLFPYPNRIESGRYSWDGSDYLLTADRVLFDTTGNAIHGLCLDRPWRIVQQSEEKVTGAFQLSRDAPDRQQFWPADAKIEVSYQLIGSCLRSEIHVCNPSEQPLPWGFGTHAYFRVPLSSDSAVAQCRLTVPATKVWELNDGLPTGIKTDPPPHLQLLNGCSFDGLSVDNIYSEVVAEVGVVTCRIDDPDAGVCVEQRCCDDFRELVVFTPYWNRSVCMEPYTSVTNAINLQRKGIDAGLRILAPGSEWQGWIEIEARPLL